MYGNNVASSKFRRITIPLFDQNGNRNPGNKYYFPDNPEIDKYYITGIEAHLGTDIANDGDFNITTGLRPVTEADAKQMYVSIYSEDNSEKNYLIPLLSLFPAIDYPILGIRKTVKPYFGRIKTRSCYISIPANAIGISEEYVFLTFYYE